jgi:hypothetical protein
MLGVSLSLNIKPATNSSTASIVVLCLPGVLFSKHFFNLPRELLRLFACGSGQFQFPQRRGYAERDQNCKIDVKTNLIINHVKILLLQISIFINIRWFNRWYNRLRII